MGFRICDFQLPHAPERHSSKVPLAELGAHSDLVLPAPVVNDQLGRRTASVAPRSPGQYLYLGVTLVGSYLFGPLPRVELWALRHFHELHDPVPNPDIAPVGSLAFQNQEIESGKLQLDPGVAEYRHGMPARCQWSTARGRDQAASQESGSEDDRIRAALLK